MIDFNSPLYRSTQGNPSELFNEYCSALKKNIQLLSKYHPLVTRSLQEKISTPLTSMLERKTVPLHAGHLQLALLVPNPHLYQSLTALLGQAPFHCVNEPEKPESFTIKLEKTLVRRPKVGPKVPLSLDVAFNEKLKLQYCSENGEDSLDFLEPGIAISYKGFPLATIKRLTSSPSTYAGDGKYWIAAYPELSIPWAIKAIVSPLIPKNNIVWATPTDLTELFSGN